MLIDEKAEVVADNDIGGEDGEMVDINMEDDDNNRNDASTNAVTIKNEVSNLNAYYGNVKGSLATLSLILNAGLMIYAHLGLSAVVLSSQPPIPSGQESSTSPPFSSSGVCDAQDWMIWEQEGGRVNRTLHSNFCSREYNGGGCLLNSDCIVECFNTTFGYSQNCSACFGVLPQCSFDSGCAFACASDSFSVECQECNIPCTEQLDQCLGFPTSNETPTRRARILQEGECTRLDLEDLEWYVVYELTFVNSIDRAWNGDAKFLAIIIVLFSGIWPYAKNIVLIWAWYWPLSVENRTSVLTWLLRLSKYTLVDVFAVISVLVGVLLELNVGGTQVATRAEPRPAIIAFFLATLWEFVQIEWVVHCHHRLVHYKEEEETEQAAPAAIEQGEGPSSATSSITSNAHLLDAIKFRTKFSSNDEWIGLSNVMGMRAWVGFLLLSSLAMYIAGSTTELLQFTSFGAGDPIGCKRSYDLVSFGNAMVSELALTSNSAAPASWTLYVAYVILILFLPITVHCMQILLLALASFGDNKERNRWVCKWTSSLWGFSSVEVLLIGIYSVESKFEKFVSALAGNDNAQFFSIESSLGPAFFILIAYSLVSGLLQYFIYCATAEYYRVDPYHRVHVMWTKLFSCWLKKN